MNRNAEARQPAILLTGPTASGKTELSLQLAERLGGAIVCMDSMQIYRGMDIGTAKPTPEERARAPHHLFDLVYPWEDFSVGRYVELARAKAEELSAESLVPVFCGGTGQYASALAEGLEFVPMRADPDLRASLEARYAAEGGERLIAEIRSFDPETAARLAPADKKRIVRALEVFSQTGLSPTQINLRSREKGPERPYLVFVCTLPREELYARINLRVERMLEEGLESEIERLWQQDPQGRGALRTAIGYREWVDYREGRCDLAKVVEQIQLNTRHYAKRQLTWMRAKPYVHWLEGRDTASRLEEVLRYFPKA